MYSYSCTHLSYRSLWITCALVDPPSFSSPLLVSYKLISLRSSKMTKIPLGISKYSKLLYILFFIIYKLIALEIIGIGQAILKKIFKNLTEHLTRVVSSDLHIFFPKHAIFQLCSKSLILIN